MNEIIDLIKNNVLGAISNNKEVSDDKKDSVVDIATDSILDGLKSKLSLDNISEIKNLFSGDSSSLQNNPIVNSIQGNVMSALMQKVGLSNGISSSIATTVVPLVIKALSGKVSGGNFDINSLVGMLTGGDSKQEAKSGGIMGKIGSLFS